jgi:hypothetical protein
VSDPALALQTAVEAALRGSDALKAAMGLSIVRLYPLAPPDNAPFPYVTIGEDQIVDDETDCMASSEAYTTVHCWARITDDVSGSRAQAKAMAGAVRAALNTALTLTGFVVVDHRFQDARHQTDPDRRTAHAVVTHRFLIDPA